MKDYLPFTLCDMIIIGDKIRTFGTWRVCHYNTTGFRSDGSSIIVDPYVITLETEEDNYVFSTLKEDTGFHLIFFTDINHAENMVHKMIELVEINHIIDRDSINL